MSSIFSCVQYNESRIQKSCAFAGVSPCRDQVAPRICNGHAEYFGLTYRTVTYHNGDNETWTKIVTYISAVSSLHIPLFLDATHKVLLNEIRAFAINTQSNFPNIRIEEFQDRIACLMGLNAFGNSQDCYLSWLDDATSTVVVRRSGSIQFLNELPALHRILFSCSEASNIRNTDANTYTYLVANVSLTYNEASGSFAFVVPNKSIVLKWTNRPNCVATPLVLDSIRLSNKKTQDRVFAPIANDNNLVC